jgi:1-phosphofructokinase/tagatose 6-phosphate kinase
VVQLIVTVTMNAAIDRTLTVPNFRSEHRHRASAGLTLAGGKGINVARALKALDVPVVTTGLAGGRTGTRIVEELTAEAILNDFVRITEESRTSTMVVDPTGGTSTEIYEWGPQVTRDELDMLLEKIAYLARGADLVVLAGSLPRSVDAGFYAEVVRELGRRRVRAVLDAEGEPLRLGVEAEPWLVAPNQTEAEALVGQEFHDEEDFLMALDAIAELGARNVLIGHRAGAFALIREERRVKRYEAHIAPIETIAPSGAGDAMLAGFLAARVAEASIEEALRAGVATGAAATLSLGGGRFDARDVARLAASTNVRAVEPVSAG